MLVALFRSNESAFDGKNMNRLRSGQIITVPQGDQIAPVTQGEAVNVVKVQAADWRGYRDRVAAAAPASDATTARRSGGGAIGTAVEDQAGAALGTRDRVSVSRESGKGAGAGAGAASAEDLAAKDKALREANSRVADLEKTVRDLQRAAALKSGTMSDLQAKAEPGKGTAVEVPKASDTQIAAVTPPPVHDAAPSGDDDSDALCRQRRLRRLRPQRRPRRPRPQRRPRRPRPQRRPRRLRPQRRLRYRQWSSRRRTPKRRIRPRPRARLRQPRQCRQRRFRSRRSRPRKQRRLRSSTICSAIRRPGPSVAAR